VLKKCRVHDGDILFIDASRDFEKQGNQNYLTDEQVEKIIETYGKRETIERYSYVAPLSEVAKNDYNLNIPRYVDTFEEEDAVDLTAVTSALQALEADMAETDAAIAGFTRELGIPSPFNS
jgi:type I restriction enzyme M protein